MVLSIFIVTRSCVLILVLLLFIVLPHDFISIILCTYNNKTSVPLVDYSRDFP